MRKSLLLIPLLALSFGCPDTEPDDEGDLKGTSICSGIACENSSNCPDAAEEL